MAGERTKPLGGWGCLPEDRTKVFCNSGDGVCTGSFSISAAHLSYTTNGDIAKGAAFAVQVINEGPLKGVEGECKYGLSAASLGGVKGSGGTGGAPKGGGVPKGSVSPKGNRMPKGMGMGGSKGSEESSIPPPSAESAAAAGGSMADMPGMSGML
jgi:Cutinase